MLEIIYFLGLAAIGIFQYFQSKKLLSHLEKFTLNQKLEMQHLRSELRIPEPVFHVKQKRHRKPQVVRKTEEDEFERELPVGSGEKRA